MCGKIFDGASKDLTGLAEILIKGTQIPGDPIADIGETAKFDFVMKGAVVYRERGHKGP